MVQELSISERRACRYAGLSRSSYRESPTVDVASKDLSARIVELAYQRRRFGYRRIHDLLAREGHAVMGVAAVQAQRTVRAQAPQGQAREPGAHTAEC